MNVWIVVPDGEDSTWGICPEDLIGEYRGFIQVLLTMARLGKTWRIVVV